MRHADISIGDTLKLKRDNYYGLGLLTVTVVDLVTRDGYKVPWVRGRYVTVNEHSGLENLEHGSFKPSDFSRKINA